MPVTKHYPDGNGSDHFDNASLENLIVCFQQQADPNTLAEIVQRTQRRALTLIRHFKTSRYRPEDELLSDINFKLLRAVTKFDPQKGSAFTFVSHVIQTSLCTSVTAARKFNERHCELDAALHAQAHERASVDAQAALDDITSRVKNGARTSLTDPGELDAQRWYIESFCHEGFEARRHVCANAAMAVHQLSHGRSRELYDLTMLEVRRLLYDDLKPRPAIASGRLIGTKCAWMSRYRSLLTANEFTRFVILMRDLAPYLLLLVDHENGRNRRADRSGTIGRKNLELILYGCPDAVILFE